MEEAKEQDKRPMVLYLGLSRENIYAKSGLPIKPEPADDTPEPGDLFEPANTCSDLPQPAQTYDDMYALYEGHQIKEEVVIGPTILQKPGLSCRDETKNSRSSEKSSFVVETRRFKKNKNEKNDQENNAPNQIEPKNVLKVPKIKIKNKKRDNKNDKNKLKEDCHKKNKELLTCKTCHKVFTMVGNLQRHINQFHSDNLVFSCDKCNKRFARRDYLTLHLRLHDLGSKNKSSYYQCDKCNKIINDHSNYRRHKQRYCVANFCSKSKYFCECCQKGFRNKGILENHLKFQMASMRFVCDYCDKKFKRKYYTEQHIMKHMGLNKFQMASRRFVCDYCDKKFTRKYDTEQHIMKHMGLNARVTCDICNKTFSKKYTLNRHLITVHGKKRRI